MKILVVVGCLVLGSSALAGGGDVFSKSGEISVPSPKEGHGGVFSKPRDITTAGGGGDVFTPETN